MNGILLKHGGKLLQRDSENIQDIAEDSFERVKIVSPLVWRQDTDGNRWLCLWAAKTGAYHIQILFFMSIKSLHNLHLPLIFCSRFSVVA